MRSDELDYSLDDGFFDLILGLVVLQTFQILPDDLILRNLGLQPQLMVCLLPILLLFLNGGGTLCTRKGLTDEVCYLLLLFFHRLRG
jgi:hypothetical protein